MNKVIVAISKPGFALQKLTTREPDDSMIEVAIASVEAVYDWKPFVEQVRKEQAAAERRAAKEAAKAEEAAKKAAELKAAAEKKAAEFEAAEAKKAEEKKAKEAALAEAERIAAEEAAKAAALAEEERKKALEVNLDALDKVLTVSEEEKGQEIAFKDPYEERKTRIIPVEEEEDEILKALDRYFVMNEEDEI